MVTRLLLLSLLFVSLPAYVQANPFNGEYVITPDDVGVVSYVDMTVNPFCPPNNPSDLTSCMPHIEVIDIDQYQDCINSSNLYDCNHEFSYIVPYITTDTAEKIIEDINKAFGEYYDEVIDIYNNEYWTFPYAVNAFGLCPEVFDLQGILERQAKAYAKVLAVAQPKYWAKVYQVVLTHSPAALHYSIPYPLGEGMIISPIMGSTPQLDQYYKKLVSEPAKDTVDYLRRSGYIAQLNVPFLPNEIALDTGGLYEIEEDKRTLDIATILEQQNFGFANIFALFNSPEFELHFNIFKGPYAPGFCWACTLPVICVPLVPVPSVVPVPALVFPTPRARPKYFTVPEGYSIPDVEGNPLPNPLN